MSKLRLSEAIRNGAKHDYSSGGHRAVRTGYRITP